MSMSLVEIVQSIAVGKSKGLSMVQWLTGLSTQLGGSMQKAEGKYLELLTVCSNMPSEKRETFYKLISFSPSDKPFTVVSYRRGTNPAINNGIERSITIGLNEVGKNALLSRFDRQPEGKKPYKVEVYESGRMCLDLVGV